MENNSGTVPPVTTVGPDFFERLQTDSMTYIRTVVDVMHEPILVLDKNLCVIAANNPFYATFQVERADTEHKLVYELGNGQWNIPSLRKLLEEILPNNTFFKGFEVAHEFPWIGRKIMILNAREVHFRNDSSFPPIILLAIEDMTDMMAVADKLSNHISLMETKFSGRAETIESNISRLQQEIELLKSVKKL
jgi:PAS domain-containing protein